MYNVPHPITGFSTNWMREPLTCGPLLSKAELHPKQNCLRRKMEPTTANIPEFKEIRSTNCLPFGLATGPATHEIRWHQNCVLGLVYIRTHENCVLVWLRNNKKMNSGTSKLKSETGTLSRQRGLQGKKRRLHDPFGVFHPLEIQKLWIKINLIPEPNVLQFFCN